MLRGVCCLPAPACLRSSLPQGSYQGDCITGSAYPLASVWVPALPGTSREKEGRRDKAEPYFPSYRLPRLQVGSFCVPLPKATVPTEQLSPMVVTTAAVLSRLWQLSLSFVLEVYGCSSLPFTRNRAAHL